MVIKYTAWKKCWYWSLLFKSLAILKLIVENLNVKSTTKIYYYKYYSLVSVQLCAHVAWNVNAVYMQNKMMIQ